MRMMKSSINNLFGQRFKKLFYHNNTTKYKTETYMKAGPVFNNLENLVFHINQNISTVYGNKKDYDDYEKAKAMARRICSR